VCLRYELWKHNEQDWLEEGWFYWLFRYLRKEKKKKIEPLNYPPSFPDSPKIFEAEKSLPHVCVAKPMYSMLKHEV
jgi:hypothetical protein